jgi:uncharacterized membrane-anchored protein
MPRFIEVQGRQQFTLLSGRSIEPERGRSQMALSRHPVRVPVDTGPNVLRDAGVMPGVAVMEDPSPFGEAAVCIAPDGVAPAMAGAGAFPHIRFVHLDS